MKKTLFTSGLLFAGLSLFAQAQHLSPFKKNMPDKRQQLVQSLLNMQASSNGTAQKPTGMQQRVIAQTLRDEDAIDSTAYGYSGTRGSKFNHDNESFSYNDYYSQDYLPINALLKFSQTDVWADSITTFDNTTWQGVARAYYRPDNKIDSTFEISSYTDMGVTYYDFQKRNNQFNNQGYLNQLTLSDSSESSPSFETSTISKYFYNAAQTQLLSDTAYFVSAGISEPFVAEKYHYNTSNQIDSVSIYFSDGTSFQHYGQTYIVYNSGGLIQKVGTLNYDNNGALSYVGVDSFGYTGTLPFYTFHQTYGTDYTNMEESGSKIIKYIGTNNLPDSTEMFYNEGTGWMPQVTLKYQYNSYNNPVSIMGTYPDGSFGGGYSFYYELYDDGNNVGIKDAKLNKDFNIYPNPFSNKIYIDWKRSKAQAKISLVNMMGQTVFSANKYLETGNNSIDVSGLSDGNYMLLIQDEKGNTYNDKLSKK